MIAVLLRVLQKKGEKEAGYEKSETDESGGGPRLATPGIEVYIKPVHDGQTERRGKEKKACFLNFPDSGIGLGMRENVVWCG